MHEKKYHDSQYEELLNQYIELSRDYDKLENIIKEVREYAGELRLYDNESLEFEISNDLFRILDKGE